MYQQLAAAVGTVLASMTFCLKAFSVLTGEPAALCICTNGEKY